MTNDKVFLHVCIPPELSVTVEQLLLTSEHEPHVKSMLVSLHRWIVSVVGGMAVGMSLCTGSGVSQAVCVLPYAHDCELSVSELHRCSLRCALRLPARLLAEQPYRRAQSRLLWLRNTGEDIFMFIKWLVPVLGSDWSITVIYSL